jgi:hypothetical protein
MQRAVAASAVQAALLAAGAGGWRHLPGGSGGRPGVGMGGAEGPEGTVPGMLG